jgi:hypothetical protein
MNSAFEQFMMQRLLQPESGVATAVYIASMFIILMWRKESIVNWSLFRASYLLFAASLVLPPILQPLLQLFFSGSAMQGRGNGDGQVLIWIFYAGVGPALFAGAVICGLGSMMPRTFRFPPPQPPAQPQPHPLD